jgi:hypothetical protein
VLTGASANSTRPAAPSMASMPLAKAHTPQLHPHTKALNHHTSHHHTSMLCRRDETWWVLLADVSANSLLAFSKVNLREAEGIAFEHPEWLEQPAAQQGQQQGQQQQVNGSKEVLSIEGAAAGAAAAEEGSKGGSSSSASEDGGEPGGQSVELLFMAPKAGKMDLQLFFMSENYVGCDKSLPLKIKVRGTGCRCWCVAWNLLCVGGCVCV